MVSFRSSMIFLREGVPESYRLYETLEAGCVPIIENPHNFYDNFLPKNPLIKINLWKESSEIIKKLFNDKNTAA